MGLFKKKSKFIDLTERYREHQKEERAKEEKVSSGSPEGGAFGFFSKIAESVAPSRNSPTESSEEYLDLSKDAEEKRKKLAKRLLDITNKLEDLSNEIYHLQQRVELLERKIGLKSFE